MTKTATEQYWGRHIEAVKTQAITAKAYAQRHGLVLSTLYYWQRRLKPTAASRVSPLSTPATPQPGKFVSLRIHPQTPEHPLRPVAANCTRVLSAGVRLEMTALPEPRWLVALARCAHGVH
jgi:hypothetical protein